MYVCDLQYLEVLVCSECPIAVFILFGYELIVACNRLECGNFFDITFVTNYVCYSGNTYEDNNNCKNYADNLKGFFAFFLCFYSCVLFFSFLPPENSNSF